MTLQQLIYAVTIADKGSMNEAAKALFLSQPSLSGTIKELEWETGITLFNRSNRGISVTPDGSEFLGYARQVLSQYQLLEERYLDKGPYKKKFGISTQHYSFAVKAFVELVKQVGMNEYEFAIHETKTFEVIENVRDFRSELGILYMDDFNRKVMEKILAENNLTFHGLFDCRAYVFLWQGHPLADRDLITMEDLRDYPCLSFDQGDNNSFFLAEEVLSTYDYKKLIKANDRATLLNLMVGLDAYTLCSGIICEELNGEQYTSIPLDSDEVMTIGYVARKGAVLSSLAQRYLEELKKSSRTA